MASPSLEGQVQARIATLSIADAATIQKNPGSTIMPPDAAVDSRGSRALGFLEDLRSGSAPPIVIERTLGEGGMGVVRLGEQTSMGRSVAVKTLKEGHRDPASVMRLLHEAWTTGALEHPNIVPVYDVALDPTGAPQVILKRIGGTDWATLLADKKLLAERAEGNVEEWNVRTLMQVCNAVYFAHDRAIIHRDLKPENVMIGTFGEVYLVDWGIAVSLRDDADPRLPRASGATDVAGTPLYMAPEMLLGEPSRLGVATDVYLLGAMLFELFVGRPPHEGPTMEAIFSQILSSPPRVPGTVPAEIADLCTRAMALDPKERPASADEFRRALSEYLEHRESMRLASRAQGRLTRLLDEIKDVEGGESDGAGLEPLFGECRFGFRAALDTWGDNEVAKGGLRLAVKSMAEHHIHRDDVRAARALVNELPDPPADLVGRLAALEKAVVADAARRERLEALDREHDPTIGSRSRVFTIGILGTLWTCLPAVTHFVLRARQLTPTPEIAGMTAGGSLIVLLGLGYWARDSLMKTALNRRMFAITVFALTVFALCAQSVLTGALLITNMAPIAIVAMNFFLWSTVVAVAAITLEWRLFPGAAAYGVGLFLALIYPHVLLLVMSACHALLTANAAVIWGPSMISGGREKPAR